MTDPAAPGFPLPAFVMAALAAGAAAAAVLWAVGGATFPAGPTRLPMAYLLTPFAALALFQLVFGTLSGRWRGWRFWAAALPAMAVIWGGGLVLLLAGRLTPAPMLAATALAHLALAAGCLARHRGAA